MSLLASIALALGMSQTPVILLSGSGISTNQTIKIKSKPDKRIKAERIRKHYQRFLLPVTKQTFKQNQRKELKKTARKKARK